jgi:hypothetical protein
MSLVRINTDFLVCENRIMAHEGCAICGQDYDFTMPPAIVKAAKDGNLLLFAGAATCRSTA